jgi:hypothetical protein
MHGGAEPTSREDPQAARNAQESRDKEDGANVPPGIDRESVMAPGAAGTATNPVPRSPKADAPDTTVDAVRRGSPSRGPARQAAPPKSSGADSRARAPAARSQIEQAPPPRNARGPEPPSGSAQATDRAIAQLERSGTARKLPYDPMAARIATSQLALQATRVAPASSTSGAPSSDATSPSVPPEVATSPPAPAQAQVLAPKDDRPTETEGPDTAHVVPEALPSPAIAQAPTRGTGFAVDAPDPATGAAPAGRSAGNVMADARDQWREGWRATLKALGIRPQSPALVEERVAPPSSSQRAIASAPPRSIEVPAPRPRPSQGDLWVPGDSVFVPPAKAPPGRDVPPMDSMRPPTIAAPALVPPRTTTSSLGPPEDLAVRGRRLVAETVPVVAAQAWADVAFPLSLVNGSGPSLRSRAYADATNGRWRSEAAQLPAGADAGRARDLYEAARTAYASGKSVEAVELELRAFAANPRDPDVAGFLAFLHLRTSPVRPETARQLALHSLAFSGSRRGARFEDWNTFAVSSALTGRSGDAARAYLLMLALSGDANRSCRAALRAHATFGDALRAPLEALSTRIRRDGRGDEAPQCVAPPL